MEPLVERLAAQLSYSQEQFLEMVREVTGAYRRDRGWSLVREGPGRLRPSAINTCQRIFILRMDVHPSSNPTATS